MKKPLLPENRDFDDASESSLMSRSHGLKKGESLLNEGIASLVPHPFERGWIRLIPAALAEISDPKPYFQQMEMGKRVLMGVFSREEEPWFWHLTTSLQQDFLLEITTPDGFAVFRGRGKEVKTRKGIFQMSVVGTGRFSGQCMRWSLSPYHSSLQLVFST